MATSPVKRQSPLQSSPSRKAQSTPAPLKLKEDELLEHARVMGVRIITSQNQAEEEKDKKEGEKERVVDSGVYRLLADVC